MDSIQKVRSKAYIESLRERKRTLEGKVTLAHSIEQLWPVISNTDQINAMAKLAPVVVSTRPFEYGGSEVSVETKDLGMTLIYEELPYEWRHGEWLKVERIYRKGLTDYVSFEVSLEALATEQTLVKVSISLAPKIPFLFLRPKIQSILNRIIDAYKKADQRLIDDAYHSIQAFLSDAHRYESQISNLVRRWQDLSDSKKLSLDVARYVYTAPDFLLNKIRPFELAKVYNLSPADTLSFFLRATKAGDFNMSWDLLCPSCKGAKSRANHLSDVEPDVHCDACGIDYTVAFDNNFELTFYPASHLKSFEKTIFCAGSPANTAHIYHQHNLFPEESRTIELNLKPGKYQFRTLTTQGSLPFEIHEEGLTQYQLDLNPVFPSEASLKLAPACKVALCNPRDFFQTLKLDSLAWKEDCVTAAHVSGLQEFRDLFGSEVLRPGVQLEISNLVFMFTDLKDSTLMYEQKGDAVAFDVVQQHFELLLDIIADFEGAIVKTIGDAIMGVFQSPISALTCGLQIHESLALWNRSATHPIILKMGLHRGPCIALNLNDKLDYFGSTINKAARIQGESVGNDIVISEEIMGDTQVQTLIAERGFKTEVFKKHLKGIEGQVQLIRILP